MNYRDPSTPRTADGKANLAAPAPRAANGKPDLSGVWLASPSPRDEIQRLFGDLSAYVVPGDDIRNIHKFAINILADYKAEDSSPMRPEAAQLFNARSKDFGGGITTARCLPAGLPIADFLPSKFVQTPGLIMMVAEGDNTHRQVYLDGRPHPADPQPLWMGYSIGKWDGDTLVISTVGFNDKTWLDVLGHPHSESLRIEERLHRRDFGHMETEITVDDPVMYTKPFSIKFERALLADGDILEAICNENERDVAHLAGR